MVASFRFKSIEEVSEFFLNVGIVTELGQNILAKSDAQETHKDKYDSLVKIRKSSEDGLLSISDIHELREILNWFVKEPYLMRTIPNTKVLFEDFVANNLTGLINSCGVKLDN